MASAGVRLGSKNPFLVASSGPNTVARGVAVAPTGKESSGPNPGPRASALPGTTNSSHDLDLLPRMRGVYRLLELFSEQGSGGVVDKIIISQDSVAQLVNQLYPGAYTDLTKIDFVSLDRVVLQPVGVYGSLSSLADFLLAQGVIDEGIKALLVAPPNENGRPQPNLKTGIYFIPDSAAPASPRRGGHVIFWPEYSTWDDNAISTVKRNRVTFMRYLTKLADQVISLMSKEHSDAIVWDDGHDEKKSSVDSKKGAAHNRLYTFAVQKTKEQEESVSMHDSFKVSVPFLPGGAAPEDAHLAPRMIAGETRQAIISGVNVPARTIEQNIRRNAPKLSLQTQLRDDTTTIVLAEGLDAEGVNHLFDCGLRSRHKKIGEAWRKEMTDMRQKKEHALVERRHEARRAFDADLPRLRGHLKGQMIQHAAVLYPWIVDDLPSQPESDDNPKSVSGAHILPTLSNEGLRRAAFDEITNPSYQSLKARLMVASEAIQNTTTTPSDEEFAKLDDVIATGGSGFMDLMKIYFRFVPTNAGESSVTMIGSLVSSARAWAVGGHDEGEAQIQTLLRRASRMGDSAVLSMVHRDWLHRVPRSATELFKLASTWIMEKVDAQSNALAHRISDEQYRGGEATFRAEVESSFVPMLEAALDKVKEDINKSEASRSPGSRIWRIHQVTEVRAGFGYGASKTYQVVETAQFREPAHVLYTVFPLDLSAEDTQALSADSKHAFRPIVRQPAKWSFVVPLTSSLRHIQLFGNGRYLLVIDDMEAGKANVFLEESYNMADAIANGKTKKRFDMPRIGDDYLFSVNESKRLLALYSRRDNRLFNFVIDEHFLSINSRSADIDLRRWLSGGEDHSDTTVQNLSFICGGEEIVLTDSTGHARVFSLVTEQFRPASVQLPFVPDSTFSTPDGSCLYFAARDTASDSVDVRVFHSASFGTSPKGASFTLPSHEWVSASLTSFGTRANAFAIAWSIEQTQMIAKRFQITNRISEFSFRAQDRPRQKNGGRDTRHNSLMDIHAEIWTKFPVASTVERSSPALRRETPLLLFVSDSPNRPFQEYVHNLVQQFEKSTAKPTRGKLEAIRVDAASYKAVRHSEHAFATTSYPAGKWLVELLCLIPLHLAITSGNRFIPLANGVASAEFERSLLGADVMQIANR